jgi:GST-like protein
MIDLYTWPTPNGHKVHIMLEEVGLEYNVIPIDINKGAQFDPDFLAISPNNKMPAMVDSEVSMTGRKRRLALVATARTVATP